MIKVIFKDGTKKNYKIGCRDLCATEWDNLDYKASFAPIAKIINVNIDTIEAWRVL